jgi:hypothetical protein
MALGSNTPVKSFKNLEEFKHTQKHEGGLNRVRNNARSCPWAALSVGN